MCLLVDIGYLDVVIVCLLMVIGYLDVVTGGYRVFRVFRCGYSEFIDGCNV